MENKIEISSLYYGAINPLECNFFNKDKINPLGVSLENSGICFSTSPKEASEVYAQPPVDTVGIKSLDEILILRKSEWYSKSEAFVVKNNKEGKADYEEVRKLREQWLNNSAPCVYKCEVDINRPFVVSKSIGMDISKYREVDDIEGMIINKKYDNLIDLHKYEQPLRYMLFTEMQKKDNSVTMESTWDLTEKMLVQFSNRSKRNMDNLSSQYFYLFLQEKMREYGIQASHSKIFKGINDSIIIETPKDIYANANYENNKHVVVFDVNKIKFAISEQQNVPQETVVNNVLKLPLDNKVNKKNKSTI